MGLFGNKNKGTETQQNFAANVFANRDKVVDTSNPDAEKDAADRYKYSTPQGFTPEYGRMSSTPTSEPSGPKTAKELLAELKAGQATSDADRERARNESQAATDMVQGYIAGLKNADLVRQVEGTQVKVTAEEQAKIDKDAQSEISRLHGSFSNKDFLTEVKGERENISAGVSDKELATLAQTLKNQKILTEVTGAERSAPISTSQRIDDLKRVDSIVGGLTNTSVRGSGAAAAVSNEDEDENKGEE